MTTFFNQFGVISLTYSNCCHVNNNYQTLPLIPTVTVHLIITTLSSKSTIKIQVHVPLNINHSNLNFLPILIIIQNTQFTKHFQNVKSLSTSFEITMSTTLLLYLDCCIGHCPKLTGMTSASSPPNCKKKGKKERKTVY